MGDEFVPSKERALELYDEAGELVEEDAEQITLQKNSHLLSDTVHILIQEVLSENPLPFKLQEFQLLCLHCIGSLQNCILLAPTGMGKMVCAYLSILVLQKKFGIPGGVGLGTQPLTALMEEKLKKPLVTTGVISMTGDLKYSIEEEDAFLSEPLEHFKSGAITCVLGHPESWLTATAESILNDLCKKQLVVGSFLDEFQMNLESHWGSDFRPAMKRVPGFLRSKCVKSAPVLAMSATATTAEVEELKSILGLRPGNTVVLRSDPVQTQFNFVNVRRPANIYGGFGLENAAGDLQPGLVQTLDRLFLDTYVEKVKRGEEVKKSIWVFRKEDDIADIYDSLCERLPDKAADPLTCCFVMNHSGIGPVTSQSYRDRRGQINLYLTTSCMLLGLDLSNIDIVGMVRPLNMCHYIIQAAGRGGRNMGTGQRRKVLFYMLYNSSDVANNVPGLSSEVREFCETKECLKMFLKKYFGSSSPASSDQSWCCSNCYP